MSPQPRFLELALGEGTPTSALNIALVVRTILVAINQGDAILAGPWPVKWKLALTYRVPYCVATWGAVGAKRRHVRLGAGGR